MTVSRQRLLCSACCSNSIFYRPQTKFAKVVFTGACLSTGGGGVSATHPPPGSTPPFYSTCWDTVNKRAVRIPLECILVYSIVFHIIMFVYLQETTAIDGRAWALAELPMSVPQFDTCNNQQGPLQRAEPPLVVIQHMEPTRRFVLLNSQVSISFLT